ncbi:MAG: aminodeoxychorismate/anthranilate synthase component II [Methanoregulaceae archaeon]|nr:aminodeoxychorismate/anthranilate synthase component II [Methanoregulaceae archaeon]
MRVLIVDCYDSFTFNLYQMVGKLGAEPVVVTNDTPLEVVEKAGWDRVILSPGPGRPEDSGLCLDVLRTLSLRVPTLGVCLGHQAICVAYGGSVSRAGHLMHGKTSTIRHDGLGIFQGVRNPFTATRYHSLVADEASLPHELAVAARSREDGYIMGLRHRTYPVTGVQFHPESILSPDGEGIIRNFLASPGRVPA